MNYKDKINQYTELVNHAIEKYSVDYNCRQQKLFESVNYSLMAGGKRLRPILMLASCEMVGGNVEDALPFAIGLEMIHTSSLIHDDLPAMDNDDLRRGKPTNHIVYGEARAILAGDVLLVRPFEIMANGVTNLNHVKAIEVIAKAAGSEGMMGGQEVDLIWEGKKADLDTIINLNQMKTGALFKAAVTAGVIIGGGNEEQVEKISQYGDYLGLAFQLTDDLLDDDINANTGKTKGSDKSSGKSTYLSIYGKDKCIELVSEYTQEAVSSLEIFGQKAEFLTSLVKRLENRGN